MLLVQVVWSWGLCDGSKTDVLCNELQDSRRQLFDHGGNISLCNGTPTFSSRRPSQVSPVGASYFHLLGVADCVNPLPVAKAGSARGRRCVGSPCRSLHPSSLLPPLLLSVVGRRQMLMFADKSHAGPNQEALTTVTVLNARSDGCTSEAEIHFVFVLFFLCVHKW